MDNQGIEDVQTFIQHLCSIGIIEKEQQKEFKNKFESRQKKLVFQLADYFKSLSPSLCYDLAERIIEQFQQQFQKQTQLQVIQFKTFGNLGNEDPNSSRTNQIQIQQQNQNVVQNNKKHERGFIFQEENYIDQYSQEKYQNSVNKNQQKSFVFPEQRISNMIEILEKNYQRTGFEKLKSNWINKSPQDQDQSALELINNLQQEMDQKYFQSQNEKGFFQQPPNQNQNNQNQFSNASFLSNLSMISPQNNNQSISRQFSNKNDYNNQIFVPTNNFQKNPKKQNFQSSQQISLEISNLSPLKKLEKEESFGSPPYLNLSSPKMENNCNSFRLNNLNSVRDQNSINLKNQFQQISKEIKNNQDYSAQQKLQQLRDQVDLQECTFKPQINQQSQQLQFQQQQNFLNSPQANQSISLRNSSIHERLYQQSNIKKQNQQILNEIKTQLELKECTFKPNISYLENQSEQQQQQINSSKEFRSPQKNIQPIQQNSPQVFTRLQNYNQTKEKDLQRLRQQKENELDGCTFQPHINQKSKSPLRINKNFENQENQNQDSMDIFNKLYKQAKQKDKALQDQIYQKKNEEIKNCTFQPQLVATNKLETQIVAHERLYQGALMSEEKKRIKKQQIFESEHTFKPHLISQQKTPNNINQNEEQIVYERLYQRAQMIKMQQEKIQQEQMNPSNNNSKIFDSELKKQFDERLKNFQIKKEENLKLIEKQSLQENGITFKPKLNENKNINSSFNLNKSKSTQNFLQSENIQKENVKIENQNQNYHKNIQPIKYQSLTKPPNNFYKFQNNEDIEIEQAHNISPIKLQNPSQ